MMKIFQALSSILCLLLSVSSTWASDMSMKDSPVFLERPRVWDGFYFGAFGGWFDNHSTADTEPPDNKKNFSGEIVGVQVGFNVYLTDRVVAGVVGDIASVDAGGFMLPTNVFDPVGVTFEPNWQASIRAKLGFDAGPIMPYVTGGVAFLNSTLTTLYGDEDKTHTGWTLGGGIDVVLAPNLFVTGEYRYSSYERKTFPNHQDPVDLNTHQVTIGLNIKY